MGVPWRSPDFLGLSTNRRPFAMWNARSVGLLLFILLMILLIGALIVFALVPGAVGRFVARVILRPPTQPWRRALDVAFAVLLSACAAAFGAYVLQGTTDPIVQVDGVETYCHSDWDGPVPVKIAEQCELQGADRERQGWLAAGGAAVTTGLLVGSIIFFARRAVVSGGSIESATSSMSPT
jgi:hypothetical protein